MWPHRAPAAPTGDTGPRSPPASTPSSQVEPEPPQVVLDRGFRRRRRALAVGVLDAQDERAAVMARQQPVEERRAGVADVEVTGGAGGETDSHRRLGAGLAARGAKEGHGVAGHRLAAAHAVHALVGLALDADAAASTPSAPARLARIASRYGSSFGRWATTVTSTLPTRKPAACTRPPPGAGAEAVGVLPRRRRYRETAGRCRRARRRPARRRSRRGRRCRHRSGRRGPRSNGTSTPASTSAAAGHQAMQVVAGTDAHRRRRRRRAAGRRSSRW